LPILPRHDKIAPQQLNPLRTRPSQRFRLVSLWEILRCVAYREQVQPPAAGASYLKLFNHLSRPPARECLRSSLRRLVRRRSILTCAQLSAPCPCPCGNSPTLYALVQRQSHPPSRLNYPSFFIVPQVNRNYYVRMNARYVHAA